MLYKSIN